MVKRVLATVFATVLAAVLAAACGPADDGPDLSRFAGVSLAAPPAAGR